jgi:hypothetical protein
MNFEDITSALTQYFQKSKFEVAESFKNFIVYESNHLTVTLGYDFRDNSISTFVEKKGGPQIELSEDVLSKCFDCNIKLCNDGHFAENLIAFFNDKGNSLLKGELDILRKFEGHSNQLSKKYTTNLITRQTLNNADKAWTDKNYSEFIKCIDNVERFSLPQSYLKKYHIASSKISE